MARVEAALAAIKIVVVEKRRDRLWAKCPYHDDHDPSWFIRVGKVRYGQNHCFACKEGGTLLHLAMHVRKLDDEAARAWLNTLGDEPDEVTVEDLPETVSLEFSSTTTRAFKLPREVILEPLEDWVTPARRYAIARGITAHQVTRWGLGYAVDGKLAGRLVVPTYDAQDRAVSYMARTFVRATRRYLYPAASEAPNLDVMFGEKNWAKYRPHLNRVIVTEGALNALAVERAVGQGPIAALGGSLLRPMHVMRLASFAEVVIFTDSDAAGDACADELRTSLARHVKRLRRCRLPDGKDACDVSAEEVRACLDLAS